MKGFIRSIVGYLYRANLRSIVRRISSKDITLTSEADFIFRLESALILSREIDPKLIVAKGDLEKSYCDLVAPDNSIDGVISLINRFKIGMMKGLPINNDRYNETRYTSVSKFFVSHSSEYLDVVYQWHELENATLQLLEEYKKLDDKVARSYYHRQGLHMADNLCHMLMKIAGLLTE